MDFPVNKPPHADSKAGRAQQCHLVVNPQLHLAVGGFAARNGLSLATATEKLLQLGLAAATTGAGEGLVAQEIAKLRSALSDKVRPPKR